jgi:hypothetical protein
MPRHTALSAQLTVKGVEVGIRGRWTESGSQKTPATRPWVGCYGHVIETRYWATPPLVIVDLIGRVGPYGIDEYIRKLNPWPIAVDEIEHVD